MTDRTEAPRLQDLVNLVQVSLVDLQAHTTLLPEALPSSPPRLLLDIEAEGVDHPDAALVEVTIRLAVEAATEEDGEDSPLRITASYRVLYQRPPDHEPNEDDLRYFAENNGVFNVWPYWRELTHSLYGRMGVPLPPLPVFRVGRGVHGEAGGGEE